MERTARAAAARYRPRSSPRRRGQPRECAPLVVGDDAVELVEGGQRVGLLESPVDLSHWLERVREGNEVVITDRGVPVARILGVASSNWAEFWAAVRPVALTRYVESRAGDLAHRRALRGADAVHLASALAIDTHDLVVAVWDRRLHAGARAEHLTVAPAALPC